MISPIQTFVVAFLHSWVVSTLVTAAVFALAYGLGQIFFLVVIEWAFSRDDWEDRNA